MLLLLLLLQPEQLDAADGQVTAFVAMVLLCSRPAVLQHEQWLF